MIVPFKNLCSKFKQALLKKAAGMLVTTSPYIAIYGIIYGWRISHICCHTTGCICKTYTPSYGKRIRMEKLAHLLGIKNGDWNTPT